jgi:Peptidase propeptide and YPEB domain
VGFSVPAGEVMRNPSCEGYDPLTNSGWLRPSDSDYRAEIKGACLPSYMLSLVRGETERFRREGVQPYMKRTEILLPTVVAILLSGTAFAAPTEAELMKEAKISKPQAEKMALAKVPGGTVQSGELEREHGKLIWSFDIGTSSTKNVSEVQVNAKNGKIVSVKTETPSDQAKEAAGEESQK